MNTNAALSVTAPLPKTPVVPPLPIWSVPPLIVVVVLPFVDPVRVRVLAPTLVSPRAPATLLLNVISPEPPMLLAVWRVTVPP